MSIVRTLLFPLLAFGLAGHAQAILLWDESTDGDLPDIRRLDQLLPNLVLQEGVNEIRGSWRWDGMFVQGEYRGSSDADRMRLTLLPGLQIDVVDLVFSNISLQQLAGAFPPGNRLRQGFVLTTGRYAEEDAVFYRFWDFSDAPGAQVPTPALSYSAFPVLPPGNNYLFGTYSGGASLPTQWDYSFDYTASITVSRSSAAPVPAPGILALFCLALAGLARATRPRVRRA